VSKSRVAAPTCQIHGPQYCAQHGPRYKPRVVARTHREPARRQARIVGRQQKADRRTRAARQTRASMTRCETRVPDETGITRKEAYQ